MASASVGEGGVKKLTPHFLEEFFFEAHGDVFAICDNRSFDKSAVLAQQFERLGFRHGFDFVFHVELAILHARFVERSMSV